MARSCGCELAHETLVGSEGRPIMCPCRCHVPHAVRRQEGGRFLVAYELVVTYEEDKEVLEAQFAAGNLQAAIVAANELMRMYRPRAKRVAIKRLDGTMQYSNPGWSEEGAHA